MKLWIQNLIFVRQHYINNDALTDALDTLINEKQFQNVNLKYFGMRVSE